MNIRISREKIKIEMSRKKMNVTDLAKAYGVSRARMNVILNSREVSTVSAGRLAECLEVDVTKIMDLVMQ